MRGPADVSGKPKANNVYAQKVVVKQAPRVNTAFPASACADKPTVLLDVLDALQHNCKQFQTSFPQS